MNGSRDLVHTNSQRFDYPLRVFLPPSNSRNLDLGDGRDQEAAYRSHMSQMKSDERGALDLERRKNSDGQQVQNRGQGEGMWIYLSHSHHDQAEEY